VVAAAWAAAAGSAAAKVAPEVRLSASAPPSKTSPASEAHVREAEPAVAEEARRVVSCRRREVDRAT